MTRPLAAPIVALVLIAGAATEAWARQLVTSDGPPKPPFDQVAIDQKLGEQVPLDLVFLDETGARVALRDYVTDRPVVISPAYFRCPMLCSLVQNGLASGLGVLSLRMGQDFRVLTVSIDPSDTPAMAKASRDGYLERYGRAEGADGWHFLTGDQASIDRLMTALGYRYTYDAEKEQYAHAAGVAVVTPAGRISKYLLGVEFAPRDLRLALVESSEGKIGSLADKLLLLCYQYDPETGRYGAFTLGAVRIGGVVTLIGMAAFVLIMLRRDRRRQHERTV